MSFASRLEARLEPWMSADLKRYVKAVAAMFEPVETLAIESGEDGATGGELNLVPNPSIEYGVTGWLAQYEFNEPGATLTRITSQHYSGVAALQVTNNGSSLNEGASIKIPGPFAAKQAYTGSVYLKGAVGGEEVQIVLGVSGDDEVLGSQILTTSWQRFSLTWTTAGSHPSAALAVQLSKAAAATFYLDAAMVIHGPTVTPYFDGDSKGGSWAGVPGESASSDVVLYVPPYGGLFNPNTVTLAGMRYLAQYVGVVIPQGATEAEARAILKAESGQNRGTRSSLEALLVKALGAVPFYILERTKSVEGDNAYWVTIIIPTGHTTEAIYLEINSTIPAGIWYTIIERSGTWFVGTKKWSAVAAGKKWSAITEGEY